MMDFYSMEKIAFAKLVEDHEIAAASHLADKASAIRLAGRSRSGLSPVGLIRRLARTLTNPVTSLVPTKADAPGEVASNDGLISEAM